MTWAPSGRSCSLNKKIKIIARILFRASGIGEIELSWVMEVDRIELERDGRSWVRGALSETDLIAFDRACGMNDSPGMRLDRRDDLSPTIGDASPLTRLARKFLPDAVPVRIVGFNKSSTINWSVPWHQDRVIAVRMRHEVDGYGLWTKKEGTWHAEPPIDLLRNMIFARVHLDDADERSGCLEVAIGTHAFGRVNATDALRLAQSAQVELCEAKRGDVLFVKALTLHRSRPSRKGTDRRAVRVDYCAEVLSGPLEWAM